MGQETDLKDERRECCFGLNVMNARDLMKKERKAKAHPLFGR